MVAAFRDSEFPPATDPTGRHVSDEACNVHNSTFKVTSTTTAATAAGVVGAAPSNVRCDEQYNDE